MTGFPSSGHFDDIALRALTTDANSPSWLFIANTFSLHCSNWILISLGSFWIVDFVSSNHWWYSMYSLSRFFISPWTICFWLINPIWDLCNSLLKHSLLYSSLFKRFFQLSSVIWVSSMTGFPSSGHFDDIALRALTTDANSPSWLFIANTFSLHCSNWILISLGSFWIVDFVSSNHWWYSMYSLSRFFISPWTICFWLINPIWDLTSASICCRASHRAANLAICNSLSSGDSPIVEFSDIADWPKLSTLLYSSCCGISSCSRCSQSWISCSSDIFCKADGASCFSTWPRLPFPWLTMKFSTWSIHPPSECSATVKSSWHPPSSFWRFITPPHTSVVTVFVVTILVITVAVSAEMVAVVELTTSVPLPGITTLLMSMPLADNRVVWASIIIERASHLSWSVSNVLANFSCTGDSDGR